jgi:aminocarboxymuconate-semialdehyde decarboxylase
MQNGAAAARILHAAADLGHRGVMIGTWIAGKELDDPSLDPFWTAAVDRDLPILLHPPFPVENSRLRKYGLSNVFGRAWETVIGILHLLCGGVLKRFPELQVVFLHGGGFLPYQIGRFDRHAVNEPEMMTNMGGRPSELLRQCYFDHILFHPLALQFLAQLVGSQNIMVGSDYPFEIGDPQPLQVLRSSNLGVNVQKAICIDNAVRLFHLHENVTNST